MTIDTALILRLLPLLLTCLIANGEDITGLQADPRDSLFKIFTVSTRPDYQQPWTTQRPRQGTGSGALLDNGLIITNAHVVADATFIMVRRHGHPARHRVHLAAVDHGADLALLRPEDPAILTDMVALQLGSLPATDSEVAVLGFPTGGDSLSTTRGVLSRVEHRRYAHSGFWLLAAQIDAAINPGNSGGPVLHDGHVVGVVMQGIGSADNIGYMVPEPVIRRFLADLAANDTVTGWPTLDLNTQKLESPALRQYMGLTDDQSGLRVMRLHPNSVAYDLIKENDVILAVDGTDIADDETIELRSGERTHWAWAIQRHLVGSTITIDLLREGIEQQVSIPLTRRYEDNQMVPLNRFDVSPDFFMFGGLVFTPLTRDYLASFGREWWLRAPRRMLAHLDGIPDAEDLRDEIVVLMRVLPHQVNLGWHGTSNLVIDTVNGTTVQSLRHMVDLIENGSDPFVILGIGSGGIMAIDRAEARAAMADISSTYRLPTDRSSGL